MAPRCQHASVHVGCPVCAIARRDPRYHSLWWPPPPPKAQPAPPSDCVHFGAPTGRTALCPSCRGGVQLKTFGCAIHGECTPAKAAPGLACCAKCPDRLPRQVRYDARTLWPGVPGLRFNPSLLEYEGGYLLAARNGYEGSEIYLGRLDRDLRPVGAPWRLELYHRAEANYGREDPRLFRHDGRVHVAYVGVVGGHSILHTSMLYARLTPDLRTEKVHHLRIPRRQLWEKNVSLFSHEGALYGVYYTAPSHRILRIDGGEASFVHETPTPAVWRGGQIRGGASPVRVGDEYWHWAHDRVVVGGRRVYRTLLVAFEACPPFRVTRMVREPVFVADMTDKPPDQYAFVVFVGGSVRVGDYWVLAQGRQDRWLTLDRVRHDEMERRLVPVEGVPS